MLYISKPKTKNTPQRREGKKKEKPLEKQALGFFP
jgi:hypothetical protein